MIDLGSVYELLMVMMLLVIVEQLWMDVAAMEYSVRRGAGQNRRLPLVIGLIGGGVRKQVLHVHGGTVIVNSHTPKCSPLFVNVRMCLCSQAHINRRNGSEETVSETETRPVLFTR